MDNTPRKPKENRRRAGFTKHLFMRGSFLLAAGNESRFKIECDVLTKQDWSALAELAVQRIEPFGAVLGVPTGGDPFAEALREHATRGPVLLADDVWTTGGSMRSFADGLGLTNWRGVVVFAWNLPDHNVTPIFSTWPPIEPSLVPAGV